MARLVGESGSVAGKTWVIEVGLTLGREGHNSIPMPDNRKSSRDHAKVWREGPGRYAVADLGSTNGTLVNDDRVTRHTLVDGDELRVGEFTFRFLLDDDEKPKQRAAPSRMADAFGGGSSGGTGFEGAAVKGAPGSRGGADAPAFEVKQRVLQYSKKQASGGVTGWDVSQASAGTRWLLYLVGLVVAGGLFFLVSRWVGGG